MVDFRKRLGSTSSKQPLDPLDIYARLDRASDKGELRRAQEAVLKEWHSQRRDRKDVIVKLHTGQGKTLIGLLILQSKLNEKVGPALYLCPDNFLVAQTAAQAKQFGFDCETIIAGDELPAKFVTTGRAHPRRDREDRDLTLYHRRLSATPVPACLCPPPERIRSALDED
jgi:superfamily II DNA/RNA helicase